jgi:4-hydroxybenzoate polyprenyltransferase
VEKSIGDLGKMQGSVAAYLASACLDHSTKHVFIVPGMILAYLLRGIHTASLVSSITLGLIAAICIASANYVINEWFDREFDKFHLTKSQRAAVKTQLSGNIIFLEWTGLVAVGLACAFARGLCGFRALCFQYVIRVATAVRSSLEL